MNWDHKFLLDENTSSTSGGAPTPSGSPAPAPSTGGAPPPEGAGDAPADSPADSGSDPFEGMDDDLDVIDLGPQDVETGGEPGSAPVAPVAAGEGEPPAPATGEKPPPPQAQPAPPTPSATPEQNVPQPPRSTLDQALEGFKGEANQKALSNWASQNLFALSKEDADALDTDAVGTIPQLMGRVYTQAMQSAVNLIRNLVPEMINSGVAAQQARSARATEALNEFYTANPHLSAETHGAAVDKWARAFRSMNPQASRADAIAFVGRAVSAEFGLMPGGAPAPAARRAAPFAPARQGGRAPTPAKGPHDPYAGMEDEYD